MCLQLNQIENDLQYLNKDTAGHLFVLEVIKESVNHTEAVRLVMPIKELLRSQIEASGENQVCTTDLECRVMKSEDGIRPCFNVQTAVESILVTSTGITWNAI